MKTKILKLISGLPVAGLCLLISLAGLGCPSEDDPCAPGAMIDGECVPRDCLDKRCPDGFVCLGNVCTDVACLEVVCAPDQACAAGTCYPRDCEWRNCPGVGEICTDEECQPASCIGVECPTGQMCAGGQCYPEDCQSHECPGYGMICIMEECVDRSCVGVECPPEQACANGFCYPYDCEGDGCFGENEVCIEGQCVRRTCVDVQCNPGNVCANGFCYPADCNDISCLPGEVCREGMCLDADCVDVQCPDGERCARGECFPAGCGSTSCAAHEVCYENTCVHPQCVGVDCPAGQNCAQGLCFSDDCQHSQCGVDEICIDDECVSHACAHVTCPPGEICGNDGACHPEHCQGQSCTEHQLCIDELCVDRLCVEVSCPADHTCAAGVCYPDDCETPCAAYQVCQDSECIDAECAGCRCCPAQACTLNNQCEVTQCCGETYTCMYDDDQGLPLWSPSGYRCNDQNPCTTDDRCRPQGCVGTEVECLDPPADTCDGLERTFYPDEGVCSLAGCEYPPYQETCETSCLNGECVGETCGSLICDPGELCVNNACSCGGSGMDCSSQQACCGTECVFLPSDVNNCGMCDNSCGTNGTCHGGLCSCQFPWDNCNGDWADGCETDTRSNMTHCGQCGAPCAAGVHAQAVCQEGYCNYTCDPGFDDCDTEPSTCESDVSNDDDNCGQCGRACNQNARCQDEQCVCDTGWGNCNGSLSDGCETYLQDSAQHCGGCQMPCVDDTYSTAQCINGQCIRTCNDPFLDCDGDSSTCETDVRSDPDHCGACNDPCTGGNHSSYDCVDRDCVVSGCEDGWCNLDGNPANGCEEDMDQDPACASFTPLGAVSGDDDADIIIENHYGETIYRVHVQETNDDMLSCHDLHAKVTLEMPPGVDYDLYIYCDECNSAADSSETLGSATEEVYVRWEEDCTFLGVPDGSSENRYVYIKVAFVSGSSCVDYTLTVEGNTGGGSTNCSTP